MWGVGLSLVLLLLAGAGAEAGPFQAGAKRELGLEAAATLRIELLSEKPHGGTEDSLWRVLAYGRDPRTRVGAGLALVDRIFPGGDPSRWEEVEGWKHKFQRFRFRFRRMPKSLPK